LFSNVLVPVDGSDVSLAAAGAAADAVGPGARVTLIEVVDTVGRILAHTTPAGFAFGGLYDPGLLNSVIDAQRSAAEQHLESARANLNARGIENVDTVILEGVPGEAIVQAVLDRRCDLVVMGTHGRSGITRTVLGSVADHVVRHLRGVPVLLIHPEIPTER